jgi:hypothetical protein
MAKEKEREFNYDKESNSAEAIVNKEISQIERQTFCKACGKVTRHKGNKCRRCQ